MIKQNVDLVPIENFFHFNNSLREEATIHHITAKRPQNLKSESCVQ